MSFRVISLTLEASEVLLSLQLIFSLERAAVVWGILGKKKIGDWVFIRDDWSKV